MQEYDDFDLEGDFRDERPPDPKQSEAREELAKFFDARKERVFFSRQVEVMFEGQYFHWVTNRAIRDLRASKQLEGETRELKSGGTINLLWHKSYRYYRRAAGKLVELVEAYSDPNITAALGSQAELLVLDGFARGQFVTTGRNVKHRGEKIWSETGHDLDFIFERDSMAYGVEVKNMLGYMEYQEFEAKIRLCEFLGITPMFVVRMMPKSWIKELVDRGGFALLFKYQLYPLTHRELARKVAEELGLPVSAPKAIEDGTMGRFFKWHARRVL